MTTVTIYQQTNPNGRTYFDGYQAGDEMRQVFAYDDEVHVDYPEARCDRAFHLFNAPPDFLVPADQAIAEAFHARRLPSLSIGDVVVVEGGAYACTRDGWEQVTLTNVAE